ncbi:hypothetical protein GQ42DRAFT_158859 [Ramicandelaber brevisporus]|nr:hypothetical protein GQ42DRAFT_158859 [Ramicandelaber brevisporus]
MSKVKEMVGWLHSLLLSFSSSLSHWMPQTSHRSTMAGCSATPSGRPLARCCAGSTARALLGCWSAGPGAPAVRTRYSHWLADCACVFLWLVLHSAVAVAPFLAACLVTLLLHVQFACLCAFGSFAICRKSPVVNMQCS